MGGSTMLPTGRRSAILDYLLQHEGASVSTLSTVVGCSEACIRRDLRKLEEDQLIRRVHGGASANVPPTGLPVAAKMERQAEEKQRIGRAAAALVEDGDVICFSGGTTTRAIGKFLNDRRGLTAVTNALNIAVDLSSLPGARVLVTGGELHPKSLELAGPLAERVLPGVYVRKLFLGVDGFSATHGLSTHWEVEAAVNRLMVERAERVIVVADHTKLNRVAFAHIAPAERANMLVTDTGADPATVQQIRALGIEVILV